MLTYEKATRRPKTFRAITGMTRPQFDLSYTDVESTAMRRLPGSPKDPESATQGPDTGLP